MAQETQEAPPPPLNVGALLELDRQSRLQAELERCRQLRDEALAESVQLREHTAALEQEGYETAALFRKELLAKAAEVEGLQREVEAEQARAAATAAASEAREAALLTSFEAERVLLHQQAAGLRAELEGLHEFGRQREALTAEAAELRAALAAQEEQHQLKVRELQRQLRQYTHAGSDSDEEGDEGEGDGQAANGTSLLDEEDEAAAGMPFAADLARLLQHNRAMGQQMRLYGEEAEGLQRQMRALEAERATLMRDVALQEELEAAFALRGSLQAREIKQAHSKISTLEKGMADLATAFEKEKAALSAGLRAQLAEAVSEQASLRRLLRLRTRELARVRRLAQQVLLQRSDVEAFLVSSIQLARSQAAAEAAEAAAKLQAPAAGGVAAPQEHGSSSAGAGMHAGPAASSSTSKVDIADLSWSDRERVLRLLFAKVNHAVAHGPKVPAPTPPPLLRGAWAEAGPAALA